MTKGILLGLALAFLLSCNHDDHMDVSIKQEDGAVWLSGGLAVCAEQIHLDNGDMLIVDLEDIIPFTTGDRVNVRYKEVGLNEGCAPGIDSEIIEIRKIQ